MLNQAQRRLLLLTATFALSLLSCGREVTGPENGINYGRARFGALALDPQMPSLLASLEGAGSVVPFERVRVVLRRLDGSISVDTTVNFPAGADSIALSVLVPLPIDTPEEGLPLSLTMAYINAAGDTVFRGGPVNVIAPPIGSSASQQPITIPVTYDGIGKDAARVAISPDSGTRVSGTSSTFSATAFDGANAPIANTPIIYYTLDSSRASIPNAGSGQVTWLANRGVARIVAALPNGARADTAFITVALPASRLVVQSGNAQSGIVNNALSQPIVLRTLAVDDVPVAGVIVSFAVASGNGTLSVLTDTSDANGVVSTNWTLGAALGAQSITATSVGLTGSPATITATATPGAPAQLAFTQVATATTAGAVLTPPVLVAVQDIAGNLVTGFTGVVSIETTATSSGPVNGTQSVNAVGGVATFADLSFDITGTYNLVAILDSTARDTSVVITVAAGAGAALEFVEQPIGAVAGVAFAPPVTVVARDAQGNIATGFTGTVTLSLLNASGATLGGSISAAAVNGLATFSGLTVDRVGTTYALAATSGALTADTSATFGIVPSAPAEMVLIAGGGQTGPASTTLPSGIVIEVRDAFQNPVPGVTVTFSVIAGGGASSTSSTVTDLLGRAATTWSLGPVVGSQVLRVTVPTAPLATVDIAATATVGAPALVAFTQSPASQQVAGQAFTPVVVVEVRDISGNVVTNYTGNVSLAIGTNPSGATLLGALSVNAINGVATFPGLFIELAGTGYTLLATTDTLPAGSSTPFDVVNTTASVVLPVAGDAQTGVVGTLLADSLVVRVTDGFGNVAANTEVVFTIAAGGGSVVPNTVNTNALGEATVAWTLGGAAGLQSVNAAIAGGASYLFSATGTVGAPSAIAITSGSGQTGSAGTALANPIVARVTDAFGNPVAGVLVNFAIQSGPGSLTPENAVTDTLGQAQTIPTLGGTLGTQTVEASIDGGVTAFATYTVTAGIGANIVSLAGDNQVGTAGAAVSDTLRVRVTDSFGNPVPNARTDWTIQSGASSLTDTLVFTDAAGIASNTAVYGALTGSVTLATVTTTGVGTVISFNATVSAGTAQSFEFLSQPGNGIAGAVIAGGVVGGRDAFNNAGAAFDSVTIVVDSGPAGAVLSGSATIAAVNGEATISGLSLDLAGTYRLRAQRAGITPAVTLNFNIGSAPASIMVAVSGDAQVATAGSALAQPMRVRVTDAFGNGVGGAQVAWSGSAVTVASDTTLSDANGFAEVFATAPPEVGGGAVAATLVANPSQFVVFSVTVAAAAPAVPVWDLQPSSATAGTTLSPFVVRVEDAFGNLATSFNGPVTLTAELTNGTPVSVIVEGDSVNAVNGLAEFTATRIEVLGNYRLIADFGALGTVVSNAFTVSPADPALLVLVDGDAQSAEVTQTLAAPLRVRVTDAFGNGVSGVNVNWGVISGLAAFTDTVTVTDTNGVALTSAILGSASGAISIGAFAAGLTGSPVSFTATATAGAAFGIVTVSGDLQSTAAGTAFAEPFVVRVIDSFGNGVGGVQVTFESLDGVSAFSDTVVTSDANGLASTTATAATLAGNALVSATAPAVSPTSFGVTITAGAATGLALPVFTVGGDAGVTFGNIEATVIDAFGNVVTTYADSATIAIVTGPPGATIGGTVTRAAVDGIFIFDDLVFNTAGAYGLGITSGAFAQVGGNMVITAGAAAILAAEGAPDRTVAAGAAVAPSLLVRVTDAFGNGISGETVTWSVASGDITLAGPTSVTNALGIASMDVTAGPTAGNAAATASSGTLAGSPVAFPITIANGPGTQLTLEIGPIGTTVSNNLAPFTVAVRDANGNVATDFVGDVTIEVDSGPSLVITGTTTVAVSTGAATFDAVSFETAGTYRLRFTSAGLSDEVSGLFEMLPGAAAAIALLDGDAQSDTVALALDLPLRVRVTDSFGNGVAGQAVAWVPVSGGLVSQDTTLTDANGVAAVSFTLGTVSGANEVQASIDALVGSPVPFTVTGIPGEVVALAVTNQPDSVSAIGVAAPIEVEARDQFANLVTWFVGDVNIIINDAPAGSFAAGTTTRAAVGGIATFDDLEFGVSGSWFMDLVSGAISTGVSVEVVAGAPVNVSILAGDNQSGVVTLPLPVPLQVLVRDANNNPVVGDTVVFTVTQGGGSLSGLNGLGYAFTNSSGVAQTTWTLGADSTSAQSVQAERVGFATLTFTATPLPFVANRTWTGDVDSDPFNAGNWEGGLLPVSTDSVLVPTGRPNYPVLSSNQEMARLTLQSGATVELGQWSVLVNGSLSILGTAQITSNDSGTVVLQGPSGGTVRGAVPQLFVSAGNYTATGDLTTVFDLGVTGTGTLDLGTTSSTIGRDLLVTGGGALNMTGAPTLFVERDASFTSTVISTGLTNGVMRIRGNVSANDNFRPAATHTTNLDGTGVQTVTFSAPDESFNATCAAGCFGALSSNKATGGLVFGSSVKAIGGIVVTGDTLGATGRTIIGVGSTILNSNVTTAGRVAYDQSLSVGASFAADTMVAFGTTGTVPIVSIGSIPTVVVGSHTIALNHAGDLFVRDDGVLDVDGSLARVNGALFTTGNGRLRMTDATDSLSVGFAQFEGLTDGSFLTAGVLDVRGSFLQIGAGVTTFAAASDAHRLRLSGTTASIQMQDFNVNSIGTLVITDGTSVDLGTSNILVRGDAILEGSTATASSTEGEITLLGGVVDAVGGRWNAFATRFQGANPTLPLSIGGDVVFADAVTLSDTLNVSGGVRVTTANGLLTLNGRTLRTAQFTTDDGGRLDMSTATDSIFVTGTAAFEGGVSTLTNGWLEVGGNFSQAVTGDAFAAAPAHQTWLTGGSSSAINFATPGFGGGQSHFGRLGVNKSASLALNLQSDAFVNGVWETTPTDNIELIGDGGPRVLSTRGASVADVTFTNVRWALEDGAAIPTAPSNVAFGVMPQDATQLRIARASGTVNLIGLTFSTVPTTGFYLEAQDNVTGDGNVLTVDISGVQPAFHNGRINLLAGAQLTGWDAFAAINWTNADGDRNWFNTNNWAEGVLPAALDSVFVGEAAPTPIINAPVTVRALISSAGTPIEISDTLTVTRRLFVNSSNGMLCNAGGALLLESPSDSVTVNGNFDCLVIARTSLMRLANLTLVDSLRVEGSATVNPGEFTLNVAGDFSTTGTASLVMNDPAGYVEIGGTASFLGTATPGGMTAGTLGLLGDFLQVGNANAFQADAGHTTRFYGGTADQVVFFTNPDSSAAGSHFGSVLIENDEGGIAVGLGSHVFMNGVLSATGGLQRTFTSAVVGGAIITSRGANITQDLELDGVRWRIVEGSTLAPTLSNVRFINQPAGITQLSIARDGGSVQLSGFQFDSLPATTTYLEVIDSNVGGAGSFTVDMLSPSPAFHGGRINVDVNAILTNWEETPSFIWTGAVNASWETAANWSDNLVPNASSVVTIPEVAVAPVTSGPVRVRRVDLPGLNSFLSLGDTLFVTEALQMDFSSAVSCVSLGRVRLAPSDTATLRGTITCPVDIVSGVVAQNGNTTVTGAVTVDSVGRLAILEHDMVLTSGSSFATAGSGTFALSDVSGSLTINGASTFGGGATTGLLTSGQITFAGDVTQSGGSPAALDIDTSVGTIFAPSASSLVSFANPESSGLGTTSVLSGTVSVLDTTTVRGPLDVQLGATLDGESGRLNVNGDLTGNGALIVNTASFTGNWARSGTLQPDTVIFAGVDQVLASTYSGPAIGWRSVVVEGTARATTSGGVLDTLNIDGSLLVRGATARLTFDNTETPGDSLIAFVLSSLRTRDGGTIEMNEPGVAVRVGGTGDFQGGDQSGLLTQGRLTLEAAFVNTVPNAYVASNSHTTAIGGCTFCDGIQVNVTGGSPRFGSLVMQNGSNATVSSGIEADTLRMQGGNVIFPNAGSTLRVNFDLTSTPTPTLTVSRLSIGEFIAFDGTWGVDTLIMTGSAVTLPAKDSSGDQIPYNDVVIEGEITTSMLNGDSLTVGGGITVRGNGRLRFNDGTDGDIVRMGSLRTEDSGIIQMFDANTTVRVFGPAVFAGGSTETALDAGTIEFYGNFTQLATTSAASYRANPSHVSRFVLGENDPVISFATPGLAAGTSAFGAWNPLFGTLKFINLATDVFTLGQFQQQVDSPIEIRSTDTPKRIHASGANIRDITFRAVSLQIEATSVPLATAMLGLNFEDQDPDVVQLTITRFGDDGVLQLENPVFNTVPASGLYLSLNDNVPDASVLTMNVVNPAPAFHSGNIALIGGAILTGWSTNGPGIWTGAVSTDFDEPGNWQSGVVPTPSDSIYIDDGQSQALVLTSPRTVGAISVAGAGLTLQDTLTVTGTASMGSGTTFCGPTGAIRVAYSGADSVAFSFNSSECDAYVSEGRVYLDQNVSAVNLFIENTGILNVNGRALTTISNLGTSQAALLVMADNADTVRVGGQAIFQGGSETGQLTAGAMIVQGSLLQGGNATAFATSGTLHVFLGDSTNIGLPQYAIQFNNPETSPINRLTIFDNREALEPVNVTGELRMADGATLTGLAATALGGFRLEGLTSSLTVDRLAVAGALFIEGAFTPDSVDFLGAGTAIQEIPAVTVNEDQLTYGVLRVLADSARMRSPFPYQISSRLEVNGNGRLEIGDPLSPVTFVSVLADSADFVVAGTGRLNQLSDGQLRVRSANFGGGDHAGMLVRGDLIVHEEFSQSQNGPITQTFLGADLHRVIFDGANTITMDNPTFARFGSVQLQGPAEKLLGSDIVVDSILGRPSDPSTDVTVRAPTLGTLAPTRITVRRGTEFFGGEGTRVTFRNVSLRLEGDATNGGVDFFLSDITFQEMEPTATFLDVAALNYTIEPRRVEFASAVTSGRYFEIADASTTMNFLSSLPVVGCINVPEGCVGPRFEPTLPESRTWTGAVDDNWNNGLNWDEGTPPPSWSDVVIPQTAQNPVLNGSQTVRNLTVATNADLILSDAALTVTGSSLDVTGRILESGFSSVSIRPANAPVTISGGGLLQASLSIDEPTAGPETTVTLAAPLRIGPFDRRLEVRANTLVLNGYSVRVDSFSTAFTGRLQMTNPLDSLNAIIVRFEGGSTTGLLTDGVMLVSWNFVQGGENPTAFAASGNHLTAVVGGGRPQNFTFQNPGPSSSHFGNLSVRGSVPADTMKLGSDVYVNGLLQLPTTRRIASNFPLGQNRLLSSLGFSNSGGLTSFSNVRLSTQTSAGSDFSASMFFNNMPTNVTQLAIEGPGGLVTIGAVTFTGLNPGDLGKYLSVTDNLANGDSLRVNIPFRSPEGNGGFIETVGEGLILNWDQFALYTFTGTNGTAFNDPLNWDVNAIPTATSNVLVGSGSTLVIDSPRTVKRMTTAVGSLLTVQDTLYTTGVQGGFDLVSGTKSCVGSGTLVFNDPSPGPTWFRADVPGCDLILRQGNVNLGNGSLPGADTTNVRDLRLEGGFFGASKTVNVGGNLTMTAGSTLFILNANDSLVVQGDASFRGNQAWLSSGHLFVRGNLDVGAASAAQFRMDGTSQLALGDPGQSSQSRTVSIDAGSEMYVDSLLVYDGTTTVTGTLRVRRHLVQSGSFGNVLTGGTLELGDPGNAIVGAMTSHNSGSVTLDRVAVYGAIPVAGSFSPDTTDFLGTAPTDNSGIQRIRAANAQQLAHGYQLVRVLGDAVMDQIPTGIPFNYEIATALQVLTGQLTIGNAIDTTYVNMPNADLIVSGPLAGLNMTGLSRVTVDSAHFQGGITSQLNEGRLIARSVVAAQEGAQNITLTAADPHVLDIYGTGWLSMNDYANNPLNTVRFTGGAVTSLNTYLRINGSLGRVADGDGLVTLRAGTIPGFAQFIVTPSTDFGSSNSGLLLRNVALSLQASYPEPGGSAILNNVTFTDMDPATIFLQALWSGAGTATATWNNINFDSPVSAGGRYFEFATGAPGSTVTFTNATPAVGCFVSTCVPGDFAPTAPTLIQWTGSVDNSWNNASNWDLARLPTANDSVVINVAGTDTVNVNTNTTVAHLVIGESGSVLLNHTLGSTLHVTTAGSIGQSSTLDMSGSSVFTGAGTVTIAGILNWNGGTMSGSGATELSATSTADIAGSLAVTLNRRSLRVGGSAVLGAGTISGVNSPTISVLSGGTLEFGATRNYVVSTGLVSLANAGTLRKGTTAGRINIEWPILNDGGVLEVADDTLDIQGNLVHAAGTIAINNGAALIARGETLADGAVTIGTGGRMQLQSGGISANNGNHIFSPTSSITGAGWLQIVSADTTRIQGELNIDSLTVQNGNTWFESADTMIVNNGAYLGGGFFRGNGVIRYNGDFVLNPGNVVGTGTMHVASTGSLALRGMTGWFVDVEGTAIWGDYDMTFGQDTLNGVPYASMRLRSGGLLDIQHGVTTPRQIFAHTPPTGFFSTIQVDGGATMRKSTGTGVSNIRSNVALTGTIDVLSGSINVQGSCAVTGGIQTGPGALTGNCVF